MISQSKSDVDKYMKFYNKYNYYLKEGAMDEYYKNGKHKDLLLSLLRLDLIKYSCIYWFYFDFRKTHEIILIFRYESTMDEGLTTLDDYVSNMSPDQKNIYYFCTTNRQVLSFYFNSY